MMTRNHPQAVDSVVDVLAVYRLVRLLQRDDVPPMPKLRQAALDRLARTPYGELVSCPWCLSVWVALLAAVARHATPRVWAVASRVLASSAVTGLITSWVDALEPEELIALTPAEDAVERAITYPRWAGTEPNEQ